MVPWHNVHHYVEDAGGRLTYLRLAPRSAFSEGLSPGLVPLH